MLPTRGCDVLRGGALISAMLKSCSPASGCPASNLMGAGRHRPGPASARDRIHRCMRVIGVAERAIELTRAQADARVAFGKPLAEQGAVRDWIAESRVRVERLRLLLKAAWLMDTADKKARPEIQAIKVATPSTVPVDPRPGHPGARCGRAESGRPARGGVRHEALPRTARRGPRARPRWCRAVPAAQAPRGVTPRRVTREGGPGQVAAPTSRQRRLAAGPMPLPPPSAGVSPSSRRCRHGRRARSTADRPRA